jgi:hypothetical protein
VVLQNAEEEIDSLSLDELESAPKRSKNRKAVGHEGINMERFC